MGHSLSYQCPLCGNKFTPGEMKGCSGCLLSKQCDLICCPRCGYSYKEQSALVNLIKKCLKKKG
jgi:hypothetical protein